MRTQEHAQPRSPPCWGWRGQVLPSPSRGTRGHAAAQTPTRNSNSLARLHNPCPAARDTGTAAMASPRAARAVPKHVPAQNSDRDAQPPAYAWPKGHCATRVGKSQGTLSGPGTAQSDSSMTPQQSGAELGLGGLGPLAEHRRAMPSRPHHRQSRGAPGALAQPGTHRPCAQGSRGAVPQPRTTAAAGSLPTSSWPTAGSPPRSAPAQGRGTG